MKQFLAFLPVLAALPLAAGNLLLNSSFELGNAGYQVCGFIPVQAGEGGVGTAAREKRRRR